MLDTHRETPSELPPNPITEYEPGRRGNESETRATLTVGMRGSPLSPTMITRTHPQRVGQLSVHGDRPLGNLSIAI